MLKCISQKAVDHLACKCRNISGCHLSVPINTCRLCISLAYRFLPHNALQTIPKRVAKITISFFFKDWNHDDHNGSTIHLYQTDQKCKLLWCPLWNTERTYLQGTVITLFMKPFTRYGKLNLAWIERWFVNLLDRGKQNMDSPMLNMYSCSLCHA